MIQSVKKSWYSLLNKWFSPEKEREKTQNTKQMKRFCACFSSITKIFPFSNSLVDDYDGDVDFSFDSILTKQGDE